MSLGDLNRKLYQPKNDLNKQEKLKDSFDPRLKVPESDVESDTEIENEPEDQEEAVAETPKVAPMKSTKDEFWLVENDRAKAEDAQPNKKKWLKISLLVSGLLIVFAIAALVLVKSQEAAFSEEKIVLEIQGPSEIQSGKNIDYKIKVSNNNRVALKDAVMHLSYSPDINVNDAPFMSGEGFNNSKIEIGLLNANESKTWELTATAFGPRDKQVFFNTVFSYQPENFSSTFEKKQQRASVIKSSALNVSLNATKEAASGEEVALEIVLKNQGNEDFSELSLKMIYPEGFLFKKGQPAPGIEDDTWYIENLKPGEQRKYVISGTLDGENQSTKIFKVMAGKDRSDGEFLKYDETQASTKVIGQRIEINQTINGKTEYFAYAGEVLEFDLKFKNTSAIPLRDLVLRDKITSPVLDKAQVLVDGGYYDSAKDELIWKASDVSALKVLDPNQEGEVKFKIKVLENFPMQTDKDKNFVISCQAVIDSNDVDSPLSQNKKISTRNTEIKINSKLVLEQSGSFADPVITNSGPIPPQVGQETTFTLKFQLRNTSNNLKNVILTTSLPTGVQWKNRMDPETPGLTFNERTNELEWKLGTIDAGTGFITPVKALAFQVGITPSQNQVNQTVPLLNPIKVTAIDTFTNQSVEYDFQGISTINLTDIGSTQGIVVGN